MPPRQCEYREWILMCCAIPCFWAELDWGVGGDCRTPQDTTFRWVVLLFFHGFHMNIFVNCFWFKHRFRFSVVVVYMLHAVPMCHMALLSERLFLVCCTLQVCAEFLKNCMRVSPFLWPASPFSTVKLTYNQTGFKYHLQVPLQLQYSIQFSVFHKKINNRITDWKQLNCWSHHDFSKVAVTLVNYSFCHISFTFCLVWPAFKWFDPENGLILHVWFLNWWNGLLLSFRFSELWFYGDQKAQLHPLWHFI